MFAKEWHVTEFFVLFLVFCRLLQRWFPHREGLAWTALVALMDAVLDEFHQTFVARRGVRIEDVMIEPDRNQPCLYVDVFSASVRTGAEVGS